MEEDEEGETEATKPRRKIRRKGKRKRKIRRKGRG